MIPLLYLMLGLMVLILGSLIARQTSVWGELGLSVALLCLWAVVGAVVGPGEPMSLPCVADCWWVEWEVV